MTGVLRRDARAARATLVCCVVVPTVVLLLLAGLAVSVAVGTTAVATADDAVAVAAATVLSSSAAVRAGSEWLAGAGSSLLLGAGALLAVGLPAVRRRVHAVLWVVAAVVVQYVAEAVLTWLVARPLPAGASEAGYAFPSGHTASATVVLVLLLAMVRTGRAAWWLAVVASVLLVAAVGVSRVLVSAHHATDVLGGLLLGLLVAVPVATLVAGAAHRDAPAAGAP